ncbi:hypothetical protein KVR01_008138 [Diaporthe batatas]|uniref:uncharacterized protein n=1 Tax=Diaporthe batatas TaxID=748121 RepID=UPI001D03972C|nr:uncharacterized protein KVR01_008138 [Diaporthe batatas]KAG8162373.1 hypothetical protein KVR01_008138 [Diaporthe batatas]
MEHDENAVTPNPELCRSAFKLGFGNWANFAQRESSGEARQEALDVLRAIEHAFPGHPALRSGLKLTKSSGCWEATGMSFWDAGGGTTLSNSSTSSCGPGQPEVAPQKHSFPVTKIRPTRLTVDKSIESGFGSLFGDGDDHVPILVLAWAYVLSARWTERIPGANDVHYTEAGAYSYRSDSSTINVPIMATSRQAARWWQAILAPGHGWLATSPTDGRILYSPWSIRLSSSTKLMPLYLGETPVSSIAADSATSLRFLSEYVTTYNVADQSRAALSAVLCLPFATSSSSKIALPAPHISTVSLGPQQGGVLPSLSLAQVDKLMTLSCNIRGVKALLLSTFFNPAVPCNLVSPFLQGTFAALDTFSHEPLRVIHALLRHSPKVGFLWVGVLILGKHTSLLDHARHGFSEIDLLSAAWTGTIQTFMQLPASAASCGRIRREDECRLAYLVSKDYQRNIPFCPWKPFGSVQVKDAELGVQIHAGCQGHGLRYKGWTWDCLEEERLISAIHHPPASNGPYEEPNSVPNTGIEVPFDKLNLENDSASCTATLNLFTWLRRGGFAASEQHIRRHEWLCETLDDEEEDAYASWPEGDDNSVSGVNNRPRSAIARLNLGGWLASTQARREDSA